MLTHGARRYGGKRERAEAALARLHASERAAAQGHKVRHCGDARLIARSPGACAPMLRKKHAFDDADDEAALAAARARSFVAPTKKARREAAEAARAPGASAGTKLSKNAAKHAKRKAKKEAAGGDD